jgi:exodeoxyribonuclease V alpha subunit
MIVSNHQRLELCNGEVGLLFEKVRGDSSSHFAVFEGRGPAQPYFNEDLEVRKLPAIVLPQYEFAYCLSVHKSQGSEFDRVLLLLADGSELFGREVLYTAVTRAKKSLELYGSDQIIESVLEQQPQRISGISDRLSRLDKVLPMSVDHTVSKLCPISHSIQNIKLR